MKLLKICMSVFAASLLTLGAQEATDINELKRQLQEANERFERALQEHRQVVDVLNQKLDAAQGVPAAGSAATAGALKSLSTATGPAATASASTTTAPDSDSAKRWSPSQPIPVLRSGSAYMNVSLNAQVNAGWSTEPHVAQELNLGDHDPLQRGFSLRNSELAFEGAVDPYFKGFGNVVMKLDQDSELELESEEIYLQTISLPASLQLKAGQFFAAFGRQNSQHPHQWAFVDQPLILNRLLGPDGLRNPGGQISWLTPLPFYTEAFLGVFNGRGESAFSFRNSGEEDDESRFFGRSTLGRGLRGPGDLLLVPRLASSFELTSQQTLVLGASAAFGPNDTGESTRTQIYGVDFYWKWKPADAHGGFPFVSWQTEALYRRFEAGVDLLAPEPLPYETLHDWGFYSQVLWGIKPRWVAGLRGEYVHGNEGAYDAEEVFRGERKRVSPGLTWHPSEYSKVRLQYNYDHGRRFGHEHSVWLQLEFSLGAHPAHKF